MVEAPVNKAVVVAMVLIASAISGTQSTSAIAKSLSDHRSNQMPPMTYPAPNRKNRCTVGLGTPLELCFTAAFLSALATPANSIAGIELNKLGFVRRYSATKMPTHARSSRATRNNSARDQDAYPKRRERKSDAKNDMV